MDLLSEYDFEIKYRKRNSNQVTDFLFRIFHGEESMKSMEDGDLVCVVRNDVDGDYLSDLESALQDIAKYLAEWLINKSATPKERASIRYRSRRHGWWKDHLYKRALGQLMVGPKSMHKKVFQSLHGDLGHPDIKAAQSMVRISFGDHGF